MSKSDNRGKADPVRWCEYCGERIAMDPKLTRGDRETRRFCNNEHMRAHRSKEWELDLHDIRHLVKFRVWPEDIARRLGRNRVNLAIKLLEEGEPELAAYMRDMPIYAETQWVA